MWRGLALLVLCLPANTASACSVPVFRYALERWKPSVYSLTVFHRGPLTPAHKVLLARLEEPTLPVNLRVQLVDLDRNPNAAAMKLWTRHGQGADLPFVLVQYPDAEDEYPPAWSGSLDDKALTGLLESAARQRIIKHLASGVSAVWVLLESGDRAKDDAAAALLERELKRLEVEIALPDLPDAGTTLLSKLPLKVSFAVVRLDCQKADEAALVRLLLHSEEDLDKARGPIAFPIFGRGRVLCALEGKSLTPRDIEAAAKFLCGACSCQVKELNPGTDLLLSADWDELLDAPPIQPPPAPTTLPVPTIPPGPATIERHEPTDSSLVTWLVVGAASVGGLLAGAWVLLRQRR